MLRVRSYLGGIVACAVRSLKRVRRPSSAPRRRQDDNTIWSQPRARIHYVPPTSSTRLPICHYYVRSVQYSTGTPALLIVGWMRAGWREHERRATSFRFSDIAAAAFQRGVY